MRITLMRYLYVIMFVLACNNAVFSQTVAAFASPDKKLLVEVSEVSGHLQYRILEGRIERLSWSSLGLTMQNGQPGGRYIGNKVLGNTIHEWLPWPMGERDSIQNNYTETILECQGFDLIFRVFNKSVAFRYRVKNRMGEKIIAENTGFSFVHNYTIYRYTEESVFTPVDIDSLAVHSDLPSTLIGTDMNVVIGEAGNDNYTKAALVKGKQPRSLTIGFIKDTVTILGNEFYTPWRTISFAQTVLQLQQFTDLNFRLAKPPANGVPGWIKPGKLIRAQLNTASGMACIDFAVKNNYRYILFDAGWYGREFNSTSDPTQVIPDIDMKQVIEYGKQKNIGVILYVNYIGLRKYLDTILPLYKSWGVAGLKFGFVNGLKQEGIVWLTAAIKKTMDHGFIINIHDNYKPTGLSRTYPALLTQEGIRGDEHQADAWHHTLLPFTRALAGPGDHTFCYPPPGESHRIRPEKSLRCSKAHQLAMSVISYSPLQAMLWYGQPHQYTNETEIEFYKLVPTTWNESLYLQGDLGKYVSIARRSGNKWYIGNIAGAHDWMGKLKLSFLRNGISYRAYIYSDDGKGGIRKETIELKKNAVIPIDISKSGGMAVYIEPVSR